MWCAAAGGARGAGAASRTEPQPASRTAPCGYSPARYVQHVVRGGGRRSRRGAASRTEPQPASRTAPCGYSPARYVQHVVRGGGRRSRRGRGLPHGAAARQPHSALWVLTSPLCAACGRRRAALAARARPPARSRSPPAAQRPVGTHQPAMCSMWCAAAGGARGAGAASRTEPQPASRTAPCGYSPARYVQHVVRGGGRRSRRGAASRTEPQPASRTAPCGYSPARYVQHVGRGGGGARRGRGLPHRPAARQYAQRAAPRSLHSAGAQLAAVTVPAMKELSSRSIMRITVAFIRVYALVSAQMSI
ncbi:forkhead box protein C1-like [Trichoplusia ni]|uniref:Forkhead box protein C1-like n=1 Tax=Trichoplusia ni TaxID=7111 RepID=A0A7E5WK70_TRINI|nr:forkhead box protein C1-like [Trichoplusia ni]